MATRKTAPVPAPATRSSATVTVRRPGTAAANRPADKPHTAASRFEVARLKIDVEIEIEIFLKVSSLGDKGP